MTLYRRYGRKAAQRVWTRSVARSKAWGAFFEVAVAGEDLEIGTEV
jgi:hypothetical protein